MTGTSPEPRPPPSTVTGEIFLVAITGSMGCGKSAVTRRLAHHGAHRLDADQDARAVLTPGSPGWQAVLAQFGPEILVGHATPSLPPSHGDPPLPDIDRRALGHKVFHDPEARARLEAIVHPHIYRRQAHTLAQWQAMTPAGTVAMVVAEIPLLFETGSETRFDRTVAVLCGGQQWQRLAERAGMSDHTKRAVIAQQLPESDKQQRAHRTIDNSGPWKNTERQIEILWSETHDTIRKTGCHAWRNRWPEAPVLPQETTKG